MVLALVRMGGWGRGMTLDPPDERAPRIASRRVARNADDNHLPIPGWVEANATGGRLSYTSSKRQRVIRESPRRNVELARSDGPSARLSGHEPGIHSLALRACMGGPAALSCRGWSRGFTR